MSKLKYEEQYERLIQHDQPFNVESYESLNAGDFERRGYFRRKLDKFRNINWKFWGNIIAALSVIFVGEASRGLVVPSLFLYLEMLGGGKNFLSYVIAGFSVGRLFGSILLGSWYNKRGPKEVLIGSLFISILGNILYSLGPVTDKWLVFGSRVLVGFGSGTLSPVRATIADITTKEQRVRFMALSNAIQFIGFAIMPGLAGLLILVEFNMGGLKIDRYTSPGFILAFLNILSMIGVYFFVSSGKEYQEMKEKKERIIENTEDIEPVSKVWLMAGIALFITLNLVTRGVLALLETVGAPLFVDVIDGAKENAVRDSSQMFLGLGKHSQNNLFSGTLTFVWLLTKSVGVLGLVAYFLVDYLRRIIVEHVLLSLSFGMIGVGALFFVNYGSPSEDIALWQFFVGAISIWSVASPISQTLILSTYSKIIGSKPQGSTMGWIGAAGSVGRIVFPMLSVVGHNSAFIISAVTSVVCAVSVLVYRWLLKSKDRVTMISLQA